MKTLTCIICPKGCVISQDEKGEIKGYGCLRGLEYFKNELLNPTRVVTSFVRVKNGDRPFCACKTLKAVNKKEMMKVMENINKISVEAPISVGQVLSNDIDGEKTPLVSTFKVKKV